MKLFSLILLSTVLSLRLGAQENAAAVVPPAEDNPDLPAAESGDTEYLNGMVPVASLPAEPTVFPDSLSMPDLDPGTGTLPYCGRGYNRIGGPWGWSLHEGLNASLDLSAFASFGRHHFSGTAERIDLMYAKSVNDKLSVAVGGYFENLNSGIGSFRAGGITALLDYRFNEHWEGYLYAQKNLTFSSSARPGVWNGMGAYDYYGNFADRIGLGLRYNFNETTFLDIQFDFERRPDSFHQNIVNRNPLPETDNVSRQNSLPAGTKGARR